MSAGRSACLLFAALLSCKGAPEKPVHDAGTDAGRRDAATPALPSAEGSFGAGADAGPPPAPVATVTAPVEETLPASTSDELTLRMRHLLEAIVQDNADLARDALYPRDGFILLRDAKDPGKTWDQRVHAPFQKAVHRTHQRTKGIENAKYVAFEVGQSGVRVGAKNREWKRDVFRAGHARLVFTIDGKAKHIEVGELVSYKGAWYVLRLR